MIKSHRNKASVIKEKPQSALSSNQYVIFINRDELLNS